MWWRLITKLREWSFILDSWCAVRRTGRACIPERLLPSFCSVTARPSRSSCLEPKLPTARRVRKDYHLHNTTLLFPVFHHPSAWYPSCPDTCAVRFASSQSFTIHSRLLSCAVLLGSVRYPAQTEKQGILFSSSLSLFFREKNILKAFLVCFNKLTVWKNFWLRQSGRMRIESVIQCVMLRINNCTLR